MSFTSHTINATLYPKLPFDPVADFTPIAMISTVPSLLVGNPKVPALNLQELIALAKSNPGVLTMAIGGIGSSLHLAGDRFKMMADVNIVNVPYKGTAPALTDVLGGQVDLMFISPVTGTAQVRPEICAPTGSRVRRGNRRFRIFLRLAKSLRASSRRRGSVCSGLRNFRTRLLRSLTELWSMHSRTLGCASSFCMRALIRPLAELAAFVRQDIERWAPVVRGSGAKPD